MSLHTRARFASTDPPCWRPCDRSRHSVSISARCTLKRMQHEAAFKTGIGPEHGQRLMEGEGILYHVVRKYLLRKPHTFKREALTVNMLCKAVTLGRWDSEAIKE
ncbi:hypothetical protein [Burkholderia contaminans]|nr:hypothetical protein [Burkholderia contaminans]